MVSLGQSRKTISAATGTRIVLGLAGALALSACTGASNLNQGGTFASARPAAPLAPAPLTPVQSGELQPTAPEPGQLGATAPDGSQVAALPDASQPTTTAPVTEAKDKTPVTRNTMVGAWTVSSGGSNCQIFLALTKWSGGYRAAPRGCSGGISDVQAWDVKDSKVVLVNSSGAQAATLYRSAGERFDGNTAGGGAISFSR